MEDKAIYAKKDHADLSDHERRLHCDTKQLAGGISLCYTGPQDIETSCPAGAPLRMKTRLQKILLAMLYLLRRFTALYIALIAFGLLLERANEQARCQAKDGCQDDMPRVDNIDAREIRNVLNGTYQQRDD